MISSYGSCGADSGGHLGVLRKLGCVLDGYGEAELALTSEDEEPVETSDQEDGTDAAAA